MSSEGWQCTFSNYVFEDSTLIFLVNINDKRHQSVTDSVTDLVPETHLEMHGACVKFKINECTSRLGKVVIQR